MAGLKTDIFKATVLAALTAILLGAATYLLSPQIETTPVATIDAYTQKGGYGPGIVSNFYHYNENVSIFVNVKDATNKPLADAIVTFQIHGPPGSNITLPPHTAKTNSSGVAIVTITAPYLIAQPKTVQGIWTAVATTEISGTQIVDALAFEVKAPPSPFVDVYTDRGGAGPNNSSRPYSPDDLVNLYAKVSNGTSPSKGSLVTFAAYGPTNETIPFLRTPLSNASGIATASFRIANRSESIGTWQVIATVRVNDQVLIDALTFECNR